MVKLLYIATFLVLLATFICLIVIPFVIKSSSFRTELDTRLVCFWSAMGSYIAAVRNGPRTTDCLPPGFVSMYWSRVWACWDDCVEVLMQRILENRGSFKIMKPMGLCALDIMLRCTFSSNQYVQRKGGAKYVDIITLLLTDTIKEILI